MCLAFLAFATQLVNAQLVAPEQESIVEDIKIEFEALENVSEEAVLAHIKIKEGMKYNQGLVDQSIRSLYETGLYQFIQVRREPLPGGGSRLAFVILPKYRINEIQYQGNDEISNSKLEELSELDVGHSLDEVEIKRARDRIFDHYQEKGYSDATVEYQVKRNPDIGAGTVIFSINEGKRIGITEITFQGNNTIDEDELLDVIQTDTRNWLSWFTGSGRFDEDKFEQDLEILRDYYKNQGFLDVEISQDDVTFQYPSPTKMEITIKVNEGRQYSVGDITIDGNTLFSTDELRDSLSIAQGDIFSPDNVDKSKEALRDHYGRVGYLDTFVRAERRPNLETGAIDLNFGIKESDKFFVENIKIQGNTKTKSIVILRELALAPGDVFDLVRMKTSEARLRNTGFFEEVNLSPEPTDIPNRRNLRITVKEGRTGNLTFGAGFSSVERAVVFAEVTQGNFDLFNHRSMFQGDGQKFRLRLSLGSRSNQVLLAFEEPWVFERELAAGFEIFRSESDFNSSLYNELRTGFEVYARKRVWELVEGRLSYRLESVDIFDVDNNASNAIKAEAGDKIVSKAGFQLLRDTRDNLVMPTTGSRYQAITEVAGGPFAGDVNYYRFEGRAGHWWPISKTRSQVFQLVGRTGTVIPFGDSKNVPFFDRYFLGGPNTLRGFDYREVGPKDPSEEPLGGNTFGYFSAEWSAELVDPVRFALFYDWGFVNANDTDWDFGDYNDNYGFGLRIMVLGAPLRVDFGFPLTSDDFNDDGMQFNFSFGTVF